MHLDSETALKSTGFRPGMLPLRSMKMHWTLNEFVSLDEQFVYKVKAQEKSLCTLASIDATALSNFQNHIHQFGFRSMRIGYLYGKFEEGSRVRVEVIYEPPQETTDVDFKLLEDPKEHSIEVISHLLGLQKVGWIFAHPPREKGFHFSGPEVLFAAEQQLEAAQGINDTPFVTMKATLDHEKGQAVIEAFQVCCLVFTMLPFTLHGYLVCDLHLGEQAVHGDGR
ncbi:hypothetical protein EON65_38615 [archaeon]|nr:MAG: hypothetical protein EON65_38615 [archaeon]